MFLTLVKLILYLNSILFEKKILSRRESTEALIELDIKIEKFGTNGIWQSSINVIRELTPRSN